MKPGDKVKLISHEAEDGGIVYPAVGTVGRYIGTDFSGNPRVIWPQGSVDVVVSCVCDPEWLEVVE